MAYRVGISESADRDLDEILTYIAEKLANPKAAADFADALDERYIALETHPLMFELSRNESLASRGYRRFVVGSYIIEKDCEITVLESVYEGRGIGGALINEVIRVAREASCHRVWLVTTNDNTHAIRFYQRFGFALREVLINAMDEARNLKPQIPATGNDDIPIAHEFEFEYLLKQMSK